MDVGLFIGSICDAPADVICTSTSPQLDLMLGSSGEVRQRGGPGLQAACIAILEREYTRSGQRFMPLGSAPATVAGALPFQAVIHCVAIDLFHPPKPDTIAACVRSALLTASSVRPRPESVAMPVFIADAGKYDFEAALHVIADTLEAERASPIERVWIVWKDARNEAQARRILEDR